MKEIFGALLLNFISICIFCTIYFYLKDDFIYNISEKFSNLKLNSNFNEKVKLIDIIMYTTSIQAGVGLTNIMPNTFQSKFFTIIQQYLMISSNLIILYFFALL